ncbi:hypothetical protein CO121_00435 [bacterium (Candidatus Gribaldobacteria) CG_4_9_14_3_um_filter_36_15]|uniref:Uncharacterized protein n=2 Tax=Candidatus Gribaldobacteria TaxID=2798536 RepID=A0A2M7VKS1_9BACT|nr:MAG: hypothetical protein COX73_00795 [bacterium (Candidatus Gribaldobacteria) CG_4_10_14_0_2_um_filter_36_18]PJB09346.1 MAG: hypothetical protein CO121_00435 [bacterium (Candidatus Gribaldobacteria) CG_4_9_14_3_um_filter_36_15]
MNKSVFKKEGYLMAKGNWKRVYQFPKHKNLFAVYDGKEVMTEVYPHLIVPINKELKEEVMRWLKDNQLDLDKLYKELIKEGKELVS